MSSMFSRLDRAASRTQDAVNSQKFRLEPMKDQANPNIRRSSDSSRDVIFGRGIFEYTSIEFGMELGVRKSYREANDLRNVSVGRQPVISIDRAYFADKDHEPRQGDLLVLLDELDQPLADYPPFRVMDNQRDGLARMVLRLVQEGDQG